MAKALYSNMATPALLAADISATATSITLQDGGAALLPTITGSDYIWATLFHNAQNYGGPSEIVKITAVTDETLTVTRGQQSTTAQAYYFGDKLEIRITASGMDEISSATTIASVGHEATAKTPVVDADEISLYDSAASWVLKKFTLTTLWTWIQTHLSTAAGAISGTTGTFSGAVSGATSAGTTTSSALVGSASSSGTGVYGTSDTGYGIHGRQTGANYAIIGEQTGTGVAVFGYNAGTNTAVLGRSTGGGVAVYGDASLGGSYGVIAGGDTTSPTTAAFRIIPQDTQPTTGAQGDLYVNSSTGYLWVCTAAGTPGTWQLIGTYGGAISGTTGTFSGALLTSSPTGGIGYTTGAGGTVTQQTSKSTGVTLDKVCGSIVMNAAELAATTQVSFIFTNSNIGSTDVVVVNPDGFTATSYSVRAVNATAGSCVIVLKNETAGALSEAVVVRFAVIKTVTA